MNISYLESIISPASKLHDAGLFIKWKILYIHLTQSKCWFEKIEQSFVVVFSSPHRMSGKLPGASTPLTRCETGSLL